MRTFIAIELPKEIQETLGQLQNKLMESKADVKWVKPENIHLTLKFLGEVNEQQLTAIIRTMEEIAENRTSFPMRLSSLGAFPKLEFPRVIWLGIDEGDEETKEMTALLEEKISRLGLPREERSFSSHITIGRLRSGLHRVQLVNDLKTVGLRKGQEFQVTKLTLFKSTLSPQGPAYEILKQVNLKAA